MRRSRDGVAPDDEQRKKKNAPVLLARDVARPIAEWQQGPASAVVM